MAGSWVASADGSGFGIENLPYGSVEFADGAREIGVRIGDHVVRLSALATAGLFSGCDLPSGVFRSPVLNGFLSLGKQSWLRTRERLVELFDDSATPRRDADLWERALQPITRVRTFLPVEVADFVDMYSSLQHATNVGRLFRPSGDPLSPNWRHMPIGYHGRAGSVVVSETSIVRPNGQRAEESGSPSFGPERNLDFELELGFFTGDGPVSGGPIAAKDAGDYIFGFVLLNDWSAREIQRWEYQPLGPNLGKSFATSISPWVVPLEALDRFRTDNVVQEPAPLAHLQVDEQWSFDISLEVELRLASGSSEVISRGNARSVYWNPAQQLAHVTSNGARLRAGDLFGTGTISGWERGSEGSILELSRGGAEPLDVAGEQRRFLEDGDTVTLRGVAGTTGETVSLGQVTGTVQPAPLITG